MSAQIERMQEHLRHLRLQRIASLLESSLEEAAKHSRSSRDFLDGLLSQEVASKTEKNVAMRTAMIRFPFVKTLESFDFAFQPSIDKKKIEELATCRYIANGENVILPGPPGGRQDPSGRRPGHQGRHRRLYRTCFTQAMPLIASLTRAYAENRIEERLKFYCQAKQLIIDEIGYIPIGRPGAHLFFQLISRRYEKGALILTSNRSFSQWNEIFGDPVIATAVLDRILHHSTTIHIKGNSSRLKEKVKAGLIREPEIEPS